MVVGVGSWSSGLGCAVAAVITGWAVAFGVGGMRGPWAAAGCGKVHYDACLAPRAARHCKGWHTWQGPPLVVQRR